jgi:hypothetical protein
MAMLSDWDGMELEALRKELERVKENKLKDVSFIQVQAEELGKANKRIAELEEALEPFALAYDAPSPATAITLADLGNAKAVLEKE